MFKHKKAIIIVYCLLSSYPALSVSLDESFIEMHSILEQQGLASTPSRSVTSELSIAGISSGKNNLPLKIRNGIPSTCQKNLAFLSASFPEYTDNLLREVRNAVLQEDINNMISGAKRMGYSKSEAIRQSMLQADSCEQTAIESAQCALRTSSTSQTLDDLLAAAQKFSININCTNGIHDPCACNFIANVWGAIASKASAMQMEICWQ